ncbi:KAP family NTPase [Bacillus cereus]|uniref:KAP family NTPase n=1 Tax=Bacillus cereus TaxID=1396 RepID=UPI0021CB281E|nr:KAP family NTPase [Bacillus cereus]MCU7753202.1 KAP family NTPase [Bacillus cereus]MDC7750347.1 KAP family NTPase [Bacillus cereus]UXP16441.1 KAP family NTPase [Bacillus cereus]
MREIIEGVETYLDLNRTDYALQINGEWGIGKTHFVLNEVKPYVESKTLNIDKEKQPVADEENHYKFIYISLNGLKNVDEIGERILLANYNKLEAGFAITKSILKIGTGIGGAILPWLAPIGEAAQNIQNAAQSKGFKMLNLKQMVLCFDDLERIDPSVNIEEVLGYINTNFVEHENIKTIFVSNQDKLTKGDTFTEIKEKVIGRTLTFNRPITNILENYLNDIYEDDFLKYLNQNISFIKKTIDASGIDNLRTLRFALDNFSIIFNSLDVTFFQQDKWLQKHQKDVLQNLFVFNLIVSNEYREGKIKDIDTLEKLAFDSFSLHFKYSRVTQNQKQNTGIESDENYENSFIRRYFKEEFGYSILRNHYKYYPSVGLLIIDGITNQEELKKDITRYIPVEEESELALKTIKSYERLEHSEMTKAVQDVIRHLKEVNYETVKLPLIYQLLNELNDKDYISINMSDIFTTVKGVIQQSFDKFGGYDIIDLKFNRNFDDTIQDTNYKEIVLLVKEAQQKYIQETQESQVQNFLNSLGTREVAEAYKDIEFQKNLFLLINNTSFSKEIVGVTNKKIWAFISFIESRYLSISNANEFYQNEIDDINTFINNLQKNISTAVIDKLKRDNLNELLSTLIRTVSHISNPVTDK